MGNYTKKAIVLFFVACLMFSTNWWACSRHAISAEASRYEKLKLLLFELGATRLGMTFISCPSAELNWNDYRHRPREFLVFDHRQRIRRAGFEPVWKDDRYILRDVTSGKEFDPFQLYPAKNLKRKKEIDKDKFVRYWFEIVDLRGHLRDELMTMIYFYQLNGFQLVLRGEKESVCKFLFVRELQEKDVVLPFEKLMMLDDAIGYNCSAMIDGQAESEANLGERGFIIKKRGDLYIPISIETGKMPEFPSKEAFIPDALREINNEAKLYGGPLPLLGERHITTAAAGSQPTIIKRPYYVYNVMIDLYGFKVRWNESEQQYAVMKIDSAEKF